MYFHRVFVMQDVMGLDPPSTQFRWWEMEGKSNFSASDLVINQAKAVQF